jgi:hypothetical protein
MIWMICQNLKRLVKNHRNWLKIFDYYGAVFSEGELIEGESP